MGNINLMIANSSKHFSDKDIEVIQTATKNAESYIASLFDLNYPVDLIIASPSYLDPTIPEDGITGRTYSSRLIILTINREERSVSEEFVFETICHEMSHSLRWEKLPEKSNTLFEGMILEGLAIALEERAIKDAGYKSTQYFLSEVQKTDEQTIEKMITKLKSQMDSDNYDYQTIFFTGNDRLPRWTGYKLGYYLVKKHLEMTGTTLEEATLASYGDFEKIRHKLTTPTYNR